MVSHTSLYGGSIHAWRTGGNGIVGLSTANVWKASFFCGLNPVCAGMGSLGCRLAKMGGDSSDSCRGCSRLRNFCPLPPTRCVRMAESVLARGTGRCRSVPSRGKEATNLTK